MLSSFVLCGITCFEITRGLLAICYSSKQTILSVSNQWFPDRVYNKIIVLSTVGLIFQLSNDVCQLKDVQLYSICSSCFFFLSSFCFGFLRFLLVCLHVVSSCSCSLFFFFLCSCVLSFAFLFGLVINHANDGFVAGHHAVGICMLKRYIFQGTPQGSSCGQAGILSLLLIDPVTFRISIPIISPVWMVYIPPSDRTNPDASVVKCYFHFHMNYVSM